MGYALQSPQPLRSFEDVASVTIRAGETTRDELFQTIEAEFSGHGLRQDLEAAGIKTKVEPCGPSLSTKRGREKVFVSIVLCDGRQGMCEEDQYPTWEDALEQMPCFPPLEI